MFHDGYRGVNDSPGKTNSVVGAGSSIPWLSAVPCHLNLPSYRTLQNDGQMTVDGSLIHATHNFPTVYLRLATASTTTNYYLLSTRNYLEHTAHSNLEPPLSSSPKTKIDEWLNVNHDSRKSHFETEINLCFGSLYTLPMSQLRCCCLHPCHTAIAFGSHPIVRRNCSRGSTGCLVYPRSTRSVQNPQ